jgi:hypothetical protein
MIHVWLFVLEQMLQQQFEINAQSAAAVTTPSPTLSRMFGQLRLKACKWDGDRRQDVEQWFFQIKIDFVVSSAYARHFC